ncbi:MAG: radical SAM protein [Chloroflexi bacterium]|nr:MAG: radical SAM protein [Chloroflexota bacterium]MBL1193701.1 radical SAM protein [Chloroflexota bacterium]NOH10994.1 radical SAM protein [Chloroflexota bacterium]
MSKLLFGQSYYLHFDPKLWEAMQPYPPLGTMYAASYMREQGHEVALFDAMLAESEDEWAQALERENPKYAIIYEDNFNYLSKMCLLRMRQAAFTMIGMARERGCTVIVTGSDASDHSAAYLGRGADFVLIGEGEYTLAELLNSLEKQNDFSSIFGLAYKDGSEIKVNPRRPDIKDLDSLPFPAWDLINVKKYKAVWLERHGYFSMNMVTTRGCPYHCNWCAKPIWGQRYNARSPENVAEEMRWLKENYAPDHIWFADDIFGLKPGWLPRFADVVEELDAATPFKCLNRADLLLREGEIEALAKAGCEITWIGAESGAQHILDAMDKGTQVEQIYQVSQAIHEAGFQVAFFLQFGYPGETRADIEKTIQMLRDCQPDDIGISVSYPLPGTKFYQAVEGQLGIKQNWVDSSDLDMMYQGPFATDFYRKLHTVIHKEYRAAKIWKRLKKAQRVTFRQVAVIIYYWLSLPMERLRLKRLETLPHQSMGPLPQILSPEAAAQPSPQNE